MRQSFGLATILLLIAATPALATSGAEIQAAISGNTVQGNMDASGAYAEFYAADGTIKGKNGNVYPYRSGMCLETQHYPDSPNQKSFPSAELAPGKTYHTVTEFRFSTR